MTNPTEIEELPRVPPIVPLLPFITGSQVYGKPTAESDIDLVIYCDNFETAKILGLNYTEKGVAPIRYEHLNLIICDSLESYWAWKHGTDDLIAHFRKTNEPIDKVRAKAHFDKIRVKYKIKDSYDR